MRDEKPTTGPQLNMISEETEVNGTITTTNDIRIAGTVNGDINTKGKVQTAATSRLNGDISATDMDLAGYYKGVVKVSRKVVLRKSARVEGELNVKTLIMEEGAQFDGVLNMSDEKINEPGKSGVNGAATKAFKVLNG